MKLFNRLFHRKPRTPTAVEEAGKGLVREKAETYLADVRAHRKEWRGDR